MINYDNKLLSIILINSFLFVLVIPYCRPRRMCMSIQLWARARFAFLPSNRRAAIHHWWSQWTSTALYRKLSCSYISWSHRGPFRRSHFNSQDIIGIRFSRVWPSGRFSSSLSPTGFHRTGWKLKSFFMVSIHLFELTYVRRVKMSFSIMMCVYDEYWYVSPREDKASRNSLTSLFVQSRPHSDRDNLKGPRAAYRTVYSIIQSITVNNILKTNNSLTKWCIRRSRSAKIRVWKYQ